MPPGVHAVRLGRGLAVDGGLDAAAGAVVLVAPTSGVSAAATRCTRFGRRLHARTAAPRAAHCPAIRAKYAS